MSSPFNRSRRFFDCPPDCPKRRPACQDHCERYLKKRAELDAFNEAERKKRAIDSYGIDAVVKKQDQAARRNRVLPRNKR